MYDPDARKRYLKTRNKSRLRIAGITIAVLLALQVLIGGWYHVEAGHRAVIFDSLDGGVQQTSSGEGFHLKWPLVQDVTVYDVRNNLYQTKASAASRDLQEVSTAVAIKYFPEPAYVPWLHQNYGPSYASVLVKPAVQETVKAATAQYNAEELITKRAEVKAQIRAGLTDRLVEDHIIIKQLDITDFQFSDSFSTAIEAKVVAEQQALEERNRLERVRYQAEQNVVKAEANKRVVELEAAAEANKTALINEQLVMSPLYLQYLWLQTWNGELPTVLGSDGQWLIQIPTEP